jgi:hypothetical protein
MKKHIVLFTFLFYGIFSISGAANTADPAVPDPFQRFDAESRLTIDYTDLDSLLGTVVLDTGRSTRERAPSTRPRTGTRMKVTVNRATVNEGNRFLYEVFQNNEKNQQVIQQIRDRLEKLPGATPLENFSRDEQLAYWINLYNITILDEIIGVYPEQNLKELLVGEDSILSRKTLEVAGVPLSLNDIQFTILKHNYENKPLVIYGLYQGIIGGPNIRKSAYSGKYVYGDLLDNAKEFINSNRGTESKNKRVFRVSSLYERNEVFFDDSGSDLTEHLLRYLDGDEYDELQVATEIKPDIDDWTITDLYGSYRDLGGHFANSNAALVGSAANAPTTRLLGRTVPGSRHSPAVAAHLDELNKKREETDQEITVVTVEELGPVPYATDAADNDDGEEN